MTDTATRQGIDYEPKGLSQGGGEGSDFAPVPEGKFRMHIELTTMKAPLEGKKGPDGKPQKTYPRVLFTCKLVEEHAIKLKEKTKSKLAEGQEQSITCWHSGNYTWGWVDRQGTFHSSKLFDFCADVGGMLVKSDMKKWLLAGGTLDPDWFKGMVFRGIVEHAANPNGGVYVNVTPQALDEYEKPNREKLIECFKRHDPELLNKLADNPVDDDPDLPF
jgi:hypothetical protein